MGRNLGRVKRLSKIDLHRHIEGATTPRALFSIYRKNVDGKKKLKDFKRMLTLERGVGSLDKFIKKLATRYLKKYVRTTEDLCIVFEKALEDAYRDNIKYLELRFTLSNFMNLDKSPNYLIKKVSERMKEKSKKLGIRSGLILGLKRDDEIGLSSQIVKIAHSLYKNGDIVGIDLAGNEHFFPNNLFYGLGRKIKKVGIPFVVHAGEVTDADSVRTAVEGLEADRIGHGTKAALDPKVMELVAKRKVILEVCPTSNTQTGAYRNYEDIPIKTLMEYEVPLLICTDDPTTSGITLSGEVSNLIDRSIITFSDYKRMLFLAKGYFFG